MRLLLPLLLVACSGTSTDGTSTDGTATQDLSGYATLDDLADMQAQLDASTAEVEALRGGLEVVQTTPDLEVVDADCYNGSASVQFDASVLPVAAYLCFAIDGGDGCYAVGADEFLVAVSDGTYKPAGATSLDVTRTDCQSGSWARFVYLPAAE